MLMTTYSNVIAMTIDQHFVAQIASCGTSLNHANEYYWNLILEHLTKLILEILVYF